MDLTQQKDLLLSYEGTKKFWRNVHDSKEWILANEVASIVMREPLSRSRNCGCLDDLFIMLKSISKSKIKLKQLQMNNEFELNKGILLFINGTHYSNANITDKKSIEILTKFPTKITDFSKFPKDWKALTEKGSKPKKAKNEVLNNDSYKAELEGMDESQLRILCDELAAGNKGLNKLSKKVSDKVKMINYLLKNKVNS